MHTLRTLIAMAHKPAAPPLTPTSLITSGNNAAAQNGASVTGLNTTGAGLIIVGVISYYGINATQPTLSDSKGNTWTPLTAFQYVPNTRRIRFYYCVSPIVGSGHNFTVSGTDTYSCPTVLAFSDPGIFDTENGNSGFGTPASMGAVTPSQNNCLVIAGIYTHLNTQPSASIDSGFTEIGSPVNALFAYKIQTTAAAEIPVTSSIGASNWASSVIVFRHS